MAIHFHTRNGDSNLPSLLLVHGLGSAGSIWNSLLDDLERDFRVFALDLPGHGVAPIEVDEALDPIALASHIVSEIKVQHGITEFHVAGNSLGGWIALELGAIAPDDVLSITALAPAGLWDEGPKSIFPPSILARILAKISQFIMPLAYKLPPLKALGYKKITHLWRELSFESCRDSVLAMARSKGYLPTWKAIRGKSFNSTIPHTLPVSIIFGDYDLTLPYPLAQRREKAPKHSQWIVVENCAHVIMWNYPHLTTKYIREAAFGN